MNRSIYGHEAQIKQLNVLLKKRSVPHALLFVGPRGIGKRTVAQSFAMQLLSNGDEMSRVVEAGEHPDLHTVRRDREKKDISVENIRNLCTALQLKPYYGKAAVAIIEECERLSPAASNALLTTLEEPTPGRYLILTVENPQKLLPTIRSRCQALHFSGLSRTDLQQILSATLPSTIDIEQALTLCDASLAGLQLEELADDKPKTLEKHLNKVIPEYHHIAERIQEYFDSCQANEGLSSYAARLASGFAAEKDSLPLIWRAIIRAARGKLLECSEDRERRHWANVLSSAIEAQRISQERTLNPQIQLSSVLLDAQELSA